MAELTVDNLHLKYGDNPILKGVALTLDRGEVVSLLGPSGSGKTTLLRAVAGLEVPWQGTIRIGDKVVFDGTTGTAYDEWDAVSPIQVYGRTKVASEREAGPQATIIRTAWMSGRHGRNIVRTVLDLARDPDRTLAFVDDQRGSPTMAEDLAPVVGKNLRRLRSQRAARSR